MMFKQLRVVSKWDWFRAVQLDSELCSTEPKVTYWALADVCALLSAIIVSVWYRIKWQTIKTCFNVCTPSQWKSSTHNFLSTCFTSKRTHMIQKRNGNQWLPGTTTATSWTSWVQDNKKAHYQYISLTKADVKYHILNECALLHE